MLSKRNCLNISRASTNLKTVPQDVTYSCCTSICLATCLAIIVITTVRVQFKSSIHYSARLLRNGHITNNFHTLQQRSSERFLPTKSGLPQLLPDRPELASSPRMRRPPRAPYAARPPPRRSPPRVSSSPPQRPAPRRAQVIRNIDIYIEALSKSMKYVIKTKLPQYI
jgi:hypothetical protein